MKVLVVSTNTLPASPSGPAYIAGAARQAGHTVEAFECLFATDLRAELSARLAQFQPDVVGVSIRVVHGDSLDASAPLGTRHTDLRPRVKEVVDVVREQSHARIVLGGPGFNYYAANWLDYLPADYGIRGEAELSFPLFLESLEHGGDVYSIPGCVYRKDGSIKAVPPRLVGNLDQTALPAYDLFDLEKYLERKITPAILTKRGCAFACDFCPYSKLEGRRYRLKSPERVLAEIRHLQQHMIGCRVMFCENNFNIPRKHAESLCRMFIAEDLDCAWGTGDLKPINVTREFCRLMEDSGCFYANLSVESASDTMLDRMKRGYKVRQIRQALESLSRSKIPFGASLMFGHPGETPETIAETLSVMNDYNLPLGVWVTIGVYLWTDYQDIVAEARRSGYLKDDKELFSGAVYLSPELPRGYLKELPEMLRQKPGYQVQFNKPGEDWTL